VAALLKMTLLALAVMLAVVVASWLGSASDVADAAPSGVGGAAGNWILVTSTIQSGESLLYVFNADKEVLLVYAFYRRSGVSKGASRYRGDLEFLAGRHCKWDMLYSQRRPYPYGLGQGEPSKHAHTPAQLKRALKQLDSN
jgi:hypothetical protein